MSCNPLIDPACIVTRVVSPITGTVTGGVLGGIASAINAGVHWIVVSSLHRESAPSTAQPARR